MKITNILYTFYVIKNVNKIRKKVEKYLIIGLGNPGVQYNNTRHQVGHMVLDAFALKNNLEFKPSSLGGEITQFIVENKLVYLAKPMTFMNLSGEFVKRFTDYYNISINNIFVIYDDVSIILGKYKIKKDSVQETLIIPLYSRKICSSLYPNIYYDKTALDLISQIDYDFSEVEKKC